MRIVSYNVNGIRAAIKKGLIEWLNAYPVDILCVQETKATPEDIDLSIFTSLGYHVAWYPAQKKGYSGVAVFSKKKPTTISPINRDQNTVSKLITEKSTIASCLACKVFKFCKCSAIYSVGVRTCAPPATSVDIVNFPLSLSSSCHLSIHANQ